MSAAVPVLLWNNSVATLGSPLTPLREFRDRGDGLRAFRESIEQMEPQPAAIRILYASPSLSQVTTTCTKGSRADVRDGLSADYPVLSKPETSWAAHKVLMQPGGGEASTILYIEESDSLPLLRAMLEEINVRLEGVFPILTALEALPAIGNKPQGAVALLHSDGGGMVYSATSGGDRIVHVFQTAASGKEISEKLADAFAASPADKHGNFLVLDVSSAPLAIEGGDGLKPKEITLDDLLNAAATLDAKGLCNLLPPTSRVSVDLILYAASVVVLIFAGLGWHNYVSELQASESNLAAQKAEQARLETQNKQLLANKERTEAAESVLSAASVAAAHKWKFLNALNQARPVPISIRSVAMTERTWAVSGYIHEGLQDPTNGPYQIFLKNLSAGDDWTLDPAIKSAVQKSPDFTITGVFK